MPCPAGQHLAGCPSLFRTWFNWPPAPTMQRELATLRSATEKHKGLAAELEAGTHEGLRVPHSVRWLEACRAAK